MRAGFPTLAMLLLVSAASALAGGGRVPVYAPTTIAQPGSYVVTRDIVSTGTAITINASKVTLDLGGFRVKGGASYVTIALGPGVDAVTIANGTVEGGAVGIDGTTAGALVFRNLDVVGTTIAAIRFEGARNTSILACRVHDLAAGHGLLVTGDQAARSVITLVDSHVDAPRSAAILRTLRGGAVRNNAISAENDHALVLGSNAGGAGVTNVLVEGNTLTCTADACFPLLVDSGSTWNTLAGNKIGLFGSGAAARIDGSRQRLAGNTFDRLEIFGGYCVVQDNTFASSLVIAPGAPKVVYRDNAFLLPGGFVDHSGSALNGGGNVTVGY